MNEASTERAPPRCKDHEAAPAVARCAPCGRALCSPCFRFRIGGDPGCARCAYEASTRPARRVSLAASFLCFALAGTFWISRRYDLIDKAPFAPILAALTAVVLAVILAASGRQEKATVEARDQDDEPAPIEELVPGRSPYRANLRRVILAASPRVSGSATALVVLASFAASAVLLPASVRLPRWIEAELVLSLWWVIVATALTVLLYRGYRLRDDYVYFVPWDRPADDPTEGKRKSNGKGGKASGSSMFDGLGGCGDLGGLDGEGCLAAVVFGVVLIAAFGAAWVFVEFVMPVAFLLMYWLFMHAIARAARDHRDCEGAFPRSLAWAALWATLYVTPIAALTWVAHAVHHL